MEKQKNDKEVIIAIIILVIVVGLITYFLLEKQKRSKIGRRIRTKNEEPDNSFIIPLIDSKQELPLNVKQNVKQLIEGYQNLDNKIVKELLWVNSLIEIGEYQKANLSLANITENLLKKICKNNIAFKEQFRNKKRPVFADYINFANEKNIVAIEEYHFLNGIREIRNEETHEIGTEKDINIILSSFFSSFAIISKLNGFINNPSR